MSTRRQLLAGGAALACIAGFRVVRMTSPPWLMVFRRSAGVLPSTAIWGDFCNHSMT